MHLFYSDPNTTLNSGIYTWQARCCHYVMHWVQVCWRECWHQNFSFWWQWMFDCIKKRNISRWDYSALRCWVYICIVHKRTGGWIHQCQTQACLMNNHGLLVLVYSCMCRRFYCEISRVKLEWICKDLCRNAKVSKDRPQVCVPGMRGSGLDHAKIWIFLLLHQ